MKKLLLLVCFAIALCNSAFGQQTVYQPLFANQTGDATSTNVRNVGQTYHVMVVTFLTGSCASSYVQMQASFDNVLFFAIGAPASLNGNLSQTVLTSAAGAYPYINAYVVNPSNCHVTASYVGSSNGVLSSTAPVVVKQDNFQYASISLTNAPVSRGCDVPGSELNIYSLIITAGGSTTVTMTGQAGANSYYSSSFYMISGSSFVAPQGTRPYWADNIFLPDSDNFTVTFNHAETDVPVSIQFSYRCE